LTHNGIDIDQFILFTIYPSAAFFATGYAAKIIKMREATKCAIQAVICIAFSVIYFTAVPNGGAQGLAVVLAMFAVVLLLMAKKYKIDPEEEQMSSEPASGT